jgi:acetyl-CoA synthetase
MTYESIVKTPHEIAASNLGMYDQARQSFSWEQARTLLDGLPGGGLNIAYEAIDRHVGKGGGEKVAIRWIAKDGSRRDFTYADLKAETDRFANVLASLGIGKGDRVYCLLGRVPELYITALGTLRAGAVFCPSFRLSDQSPSRRACRSARRLCLSHRSRSIGARSSRGVASSPG